MEIHITGLKYLSSAWLSFPLYAVQFFSYTHCVYSFGLMAELYCCASFLIPSGKPLGFYTQHCLHPCWLASFLFLSLVTLLHVFARLIRETA